MPGVVKHSFIGQILLSLYKHLKFFITLDEKKKIIEFKSTVHYSFEIFLYLEILANNYFHYCIVPASAPRLVQQRLWYVLSCLGWCI